MAQSRWTLARALPYKSFPCHAMPCTASFHPSIWKWVYPSQARTPNTREMRRAESPPCFVPKSGTRREAQYHRWRQHSTRHRSSCTAEPSSPAVQRRSWPPQQQTPTGKASTRPERVEHPPPRSSRMTWKKARQSYRLGCRWRPGRKRMRHPRTGCCFRAG